VVAFLVWAKVERQWPFGPKRIREAFADPGRIPAAPDAAGARAGVAP
jgi:hypothetical protein